MDTRHASDARESGDVADGALRAGNLTGPRRVIAAKKKAAKKKAAGTTSATPPSSVDSSDAAPAAKKATTKKKTARKKTAAKKSKTTPAAGGKKKAGKKAAKKTRASASDDSLTEGDEDYTDSDDAIDVPSLDGDGDAKSKKKAGKKAAASKKKKSGRPARKYEPINAKGKNLVIVESPAKAKTINKFLGSQFVVASSIGHIRDLSKAKAKDENNKIKPWAVGGIDVDKGFKQAYEVIEEKENVVRELSKAAKAADLVYLAPDPDREGEAIAWHLQAVLGVPEKKLRRIVFNEITERAVKDAIAHAGDINQQLVDAQLARRGLDRLVGYTLSPLLWDKVVRGLSAGRVQSVAVRLIVEREREIRAFRSHDYWTVDADVRKPEGQRLKGEPEKIRLGLKQWRATDHEMGLKLRPAIEREIEAGTLSGKADDILKQRLAALTKDADGHYPLTSLDPQTDLREKPFVDEIVEYLRDAQYKVSLVKETKRTEKPRPPFITSTLQRAAATHLHFGAKKTMGLAQRLYEGIDLGDGPVGLITYMRTDSTRLADEATAACRKFIDAEYGPKYLPDAVRVYKTKAKGAQEAHEAIRPTNVEIAPDRIRATFMTGGSGKTAKEKEDLFRLYELIWKQFVACQMADHEYLQTTVEVTADRALLRASGRKQIFDGFTRVTRGTADEEGADGTGAAGKSGG
ncbi:MAG: type I DNA topoisomerase, partial [Planctomycetota bacterium]